jgi:hypothetical protein
MMNDELRGRKAARALSEHAKNLLYSAPKLYAAPSTTNKLSEGKDDYVMAEASAREKAFGLMDGSSGRADVVGRHFRLIICISIEVLPRAFFFTLYSGSFHF